MRDLICIGASAGGIEALCTLVAHLPARFPATFFVVLHIPPFLTSRLDEIIDRAGPLRATMARDGELFKRSRIYIAPPDHHLLLDGDRLMVIKGPKENRFRPAIDPLFRSAAQSAPKRSIGVLLSGLMDDGTAGLWALKRRGGTTVLQEFDDALFPEMPRNASKFVTIDHMASAAGMAALLARLISAAPLRSRESPLGEILAIENDYARLKKVPRDKLENVGTPTSLICPLCSGPLWRVDEGPRRLRCHTGHSFTPQSLLAEHRELAERTLGVLMTLFDDEVTLTQHLIEAAKDQEQADVAKRLVDESRKRSVALRKLLPGGFSQSERVKRAQAGGGTGRTRGAQVRAGAVEGPRAGAKVGAKSRKAAGRGLRGRAAS